MDGDLSAVPFYRGGAPEAIMALGMPDSAAAWLAREAPHGSLATLWSTAFDPIRDHPVYLKMLRDQNLEGATPIRTPQ